MKRVALWNGGALAGALVLSTAVAWVPRVGSSAPAPAASEAQGGGADGALSATLTDHVGATVARANYQRIVSMSTVADELLLELCEPERIVSFTSYSANGASTVKAHQFKGKPVFDGVKDVEAVLTLHPDLVLVNTVGDRRPLARFGEAGLAVYELGEMRGLATLIPNIHEVAALIGHPERGRRFAEAFVAQMHMVAADIPAASRKRGLYLTTYAGRLYGGGAGTSYHDVLIAAGVLDAAAAAGYHDWPEYSVEQLLALDPDIIITGDGMRVRICEHAGLGGMRVCASPSAIVELEVGLVGDPGTGMLDAALAVRRAVYGAPGAHDSETTSTSTTSTKGQGR